MQQINLQHVYKSFQKKILSFEFPGHDGILLTSASRVICACLITAQAPSSARLLVRRNSCIASRSSFWGAHSKRYTN